ncbi:MAG: hypothetical protein ACQESD_01760 [Thermoplasmatota archaeon]
MLLPPHTPMLIGFFGDLLIAISVGFGLLVLIILISLSGLFKGEEDESRTPSCGTCGTTDGHCEMCGHNLGEKETSLEYRIDTTAGKTKKVDEEIPDVPEKKRFCKECNTELVYREFYDRYYCPTCRSYKQK